MTPPRGNAWSVRLRACAVWRRALLLLEVLLSIAIFVMAAMAIIAVVNGGVSGLEAARDAVRAADLARSAMARIEAGLDTPQELTGPVARWEDDAEAVEADEALGAAGQRTGFADAPPGPSLWELEVETEPSTFAGLTSVTVRAIKRASPGSVGIRASYTLHQLVRLSGKGEDRAGDIDEIVERARTAPPRPVPGGGP